MSDPGMPSSLTTLRRTIVASLVLAVVVTIVVSLHDGTVASPWTNALGVLLGGLAGTFIGEHLQRFGERATATRIAWLQMATIGLVVVATIGWQSLPAYCQLPVSFVMGAVVATATIYIQRLRIGR
jgi:hypothetical protein